MALNPVVRRADRALVALSLFALAVPVGVALVPAVQTDVPMAAPRIGDDVVYVQDGQEQRFSFEDVDMVHRSDGRPVEAWRFRLADGVWWIDPRGADAVATGDVERWQREAEPLLGPTVMTGIRLRQMVPDAAPPCVLVANRFFGDGRLPACDLGDTHWPGGRLAVSSDPSGAVASGTAQGLQATIVHTAGQAYPASIQVGHAVARLDHVTSGNVTTARVPLASMAQPLVEHPPMPWGSSSSGTEIGWPLEAAYRAALDDLLWTDLRDWVAEHDPVPITATLETYELQEHRTEQWDVLLADGADRFHLRATRDTAGGWNVPHVDILRGDDFSGTSRHGVPVDVPTAWPTLASLEARARAYLPPELADERMTRYAFAVDDGRLTYTLTHDRPPRPSIVEGSVERRLEDSSFWEVTMDADGTVHGVVAERSYDGPPESAPDGGRDVSWQTQSITTTDPAVGWPVSTATAVTAGAVAVAWALRLLAGALYSRVIGPEALTQETRARIADAVAAEPGIHRAALARRIGVHPRAIDHHLRVLAGSGAIRTRRQHRYLCVYPGSGRVVRAPSCSSARRVHAALMEAPGSTLSAIAVTLGLSVSTVHHHIRRMERDGLVTAQRQGRAVALYAVPFDRQ